MSGTPLMSIFRLQMTCLIIYSYAITLTCTKTSQKVKHEAQEPAEATVQIIHYCTKKRKEKVRKGPGFISISLYSSRSSSLSLNAGTKQRAIGWTQVENPCQVSHIKCNFHASESFINRQALIRRE